MTISPVNESYFFISFSSDHPPFVVFAVAAARSVGSRCRGPRRTQDNVHATFHTGTRGLCTALGLSQALQAQSWSGRWNRRQRVSKRQRPAARAAARASSVSRRVTRRLISWNFSSVSTR